jgi:hypothetical protein
MLTKFWSEILKGRGHLGRPSRRREDNIKMDHTEKGREGVDWIFLAQDMNEWRAVVNRKMNILFQY